MPGAAEASSVAHLPRLSWRHPEQDMRPVRLCRQLQAPAALEPALKERHAAAPNSFADLLAAGRVLFWRCQRQPDLGVQLRLLPALTQALLLLLVNLGETRALQVLQT